MNFDFEKELLAEGYQLIAGIDEVGRGALAGPVLAGAVVLPLPLDASWLKLIRDSKELTPKKRELLYSYIKETALGIGVGVIPPQVIDQKGILTATRLAMLEAIKNLPFTPQFLLIDALKIPSPLPQRSIISGDKRSISIACASIVAKVIRDKIMKEMDEIYPSYEFARNKGYATPKHLSILKQMGPCPIHRFSFRPLRQIK